jgi:hypothetical protein
MTMSAPAAAIIFHQCSKSNFFKSKSANSASVGGLEPANEDRAPAESQGSVGACPGNAQRGDA